MMDEDIERMLEAPFNRQKIEENYKNRYDRNNQDRSYKKRSSSRSRRKSRSRSRCKSRSRSCRRSRSRSRRKSRSRSRRKSNSRRCKSRSRSYQSSRSRKHHSRKRSESGEEKNERKSLERERKRTSQERRMLEQLSEEEKDARTIYIWQLSLRVRARDLEKFFTVVGKIDVVRLVLDNKTGKSRGVAFIQFRTVESVNKALDLNGQKLLGVPIQIRTVSSEKCRAAEGTMSSSYIYFRGSTKLCISNLHTQINEQMLQDILSPYGKIDELRLMKDIRGQSLGTAFILFRKGENAKNVVEQMNDFNLAGQLLKITPVIEESGFNDFGENQGVSMTAADRLGLMTKLAVGTDLLVSTVVNTNDQISIINSQCFILSNMFDPNDVTDEAFCKEIRDDIIGECNQFGGVYHIYVNRKSLKGEVYVKCPSIYVANKCVSTLHGRSFDGRLITANYIPLEHYHRMFFESISINKLLRIND